MELVNYLGKSLNSAANFAIGVLSFSVGEDRYLHSNMITSQFGPIMGQRIKTKMFLGVVPIISESALHATYEDSEDYVNSRGYRHHMIGSKDYEKLSKSLDEQDRRVNKSLEATA